MNSTPPTQPQPIQPQGSSSLEPAPSSFCQCLIDLVKAILQAIWDCCSTSPSTNLQNRASSQSTTFPGSDVGSRAPFPATFEVFLDLLPDVKKCFDEGKTVDLWIIESGLGMIDKKYKNQTKEQLQGIFNTISKTYHGCAREIYYWVHMIFSSGETPMGGLSRIKPIGSSPLSN